MQLRILAPCLMCLAFLSDASGGPRLASQKLNGGKSVFQTVDTVDALRALYPYGTAGVMVRGYHTPDDGAGGLFAWDPSAGEPDDGGLVIEPTGGPVLGRWKRVVSGPINLNWFGLQANTDIGPALAELFTRFGNGERHHFVLMPGDYTSSVPLKIADPSYQVWDFRGVTIVFDMEVIGVLFELGDSTGAENYVFDTTVHAPLVEHAHVDDDDVAIRGSGQETIGFRTSNLYHSHVDGIGARFCTIGFQPLATGDKGNAYNEYHLRRFMNCVVSLRPTAAATGYVNENLYVGGRFWNNWGVTCTSSPGACGSDDESLLEAHVILPERTQSTLLKPSFEGLGQNAVRIISSNNVILSPRPEFDSTGGPCLHLDDEHSSVTEFPDAVIAINPASHANRIEMLYWDGEVVPYETTEPAGRGNRWRTREGTYLSLDAPDDSSFLPQRTLDRNTAIFNGTAADMIRDLYVNSGVPWGRRYEAQRPAVSESVSIGDQERYQLHHWGSFTTMFLGSSAHMHSDTETVPPPFRRVASASAAELEDGDTFKGRDAVRWFYDGDGWRRYDALKIAEVVIGPGGASVPHGLPYTPSQIQVLPHGDANVWQSDPPSGTHVFMKSSAEVIVDIFVR